ncbi:type II toxin-antitoxin system VapC family toxin [archaeon]|nr:type II toxin-antitoxin system VapC family toxin [archaeon]MBU2565312.1 PIN domain-containing protein [Candidatus Thermoplasmatota archaeon]
MTCFIDTSMFVAAYNKKDKYHSDANKILSDAFEGEYGTIYTSDYILNETITLILKRMKNVKIAKQLGNAILSSPRINLVVIDTRIVLNAYTTFIKKSYLFDSFTDYTSYEMTKEYNIEHLLSYDSDFDKVDVNRVY